MIAFIIAPHVAYTNSASFVEYRSLPKQPDFVLRRSRRRRPSSGHLPGNV